MAAASPLGPASALDAYLTKQGEAAAAAASDPVTIRKCVAASSNPGAMAALQREMAVATDQALAGELGALFSQFDANGDGHLDLKEECGLMNLFILKSAEHNKQVMFTMTTEGLGPILDQIYSDDTGMTRAEFDDLMATVFSDAIMPALAKTFDMVRDDQLARIEQISQAMFDAIDENHDGKLSKEEFVSHFGAAAREFGKPSAAQQAKIQDAVQSSMVRAMPRLEKAINDKIAERNCTCVVM